MHIKVLPFLILSFLMFFALKTKAQDLPSNEEEYDSIYAINIQLSKINGVYIPKDIEDAHRRILDLSPASSIKKFLAEEEKEVCAKLHFGIGRWMIINWNFYDGSRISHYLKTKGLSHPDDMAQYLLRTLHRKMNKKELDEVSIIEELLVERKKEIESVYKN